MLRKQVQGGMYLRSELTGQLTVEADWQGEWHEHPFDELVHICRGSFFLEWAGQHRHVSSGSAILIPAGIRHRFRSMAPESRMLYIGASLRYHEVPVKLALTDCAGITTEPALAALRNADALFCAPCQTPAVLPASLIAQFTPLWESYLPPLLPGEEDAVTANRICEYLSDHIGEKIIAEKLAASFYLTPRTMNTIFQRAVGASVKQYLKRLRMEKALLLLQTSELPICEIAEMLGFDTVQYFSACIREQYGASPRSLRQERRKKEAPQPESL